MTDMLQTHDNYLDNAVNEGGMGPYIVPPWGRRAPSWPWSVSLRVIQIYSLLKCEYAVYMQPSSLSDTTRPVVPIAAVPPFVIIFWWTIDDLLCDVSRYTNVKSGIQQNIYTAVFNISHNWTI